MNYDSIDIFITMYIVILIMGRIINGLMKVTLTTLLPRTDLYTKVASGIYCKNRGLNDCEIRSIIKAHKSRQSWMHK